MNKSNILNKKVKHNKNDKNTNDATQSSSAQERDVFFTIEENIGFIKSIFGDGIGLIERKYSICKDKVQAVLIYVDSLSDIKIISSHIIDPLLNTSKDLNIGHNDVLELIQSKVIFVPNTKISSQMKDVINGLLNGSTVLFINDNNRALIIESQAVQNRPIEKPDTEATMLGSLDSLTEDINTNCYLVNKRLPTPDLKFEKFTVGKLSQTKVKLLWLEGIANTEAIEDVRNRIRKINIDTVDGIGVLSELIRDHALSIFPTYMQTQRPDVIAKSLTDGQFAILCNNSPYGFIGPTTFWDHFKTMDDYAQNTFISTYMRFVRYLAFLISTVISPLYIACVAYNHSIVPPELAHNIALGRDGVPFPSIIEIILLTLTISLIREASLRIPGPIGYFIGAMSAIVIGQASVSAGYVSASVIIVISISIISAFAVSSSTLLYTTILINYFLIILAGVFGMFGLISGVVVIIWHMVSLYSFGVPFLYPLVPFDLDAMKDTLIRAPLNSLKKRFALLAPENQTRMNDRDAKNTTKMESNP